MKMKKKHRRSHPKAHRNAASSAAPSRARPARLLKRAPAPPWQTIAAAVAGGAGGAALGGLVVNQKILSPEAVGLGLMLGGGATAYFAEGTARVIGTSIAAAGAGQLALSTMAKQALKTEQPSAPGTTPSATTQAALPPPPPVAPPRKSATGGGVVVDLFRDAVTDLDLIEDQWRYGMRDYAGQSGTASEGSEPIVIDLDEAA
ncbi:MAG: hypothetical protein ACTHU0_10345 [Kofleriaceae bacterium]